MELSARRREPGPRAVDRLLRKTVGEDDSPLALSLFPFDVFLRRKPRGAEHPTGSKLVVKRIASKETNPRVPVDGDALVAEVRFRTHARARGGALEVFFVSLRSPSTSRASFRALAFAANDEILSPESSASF